LCRGDGGFTGEGCSHAQDGRFAGGDRSDAYGWAPGDRDAGAWRMQDGLSCSTTRITARGRWRKSTWRCWRRAARSRRLQLRRLQQRCQQRRCLQLRCQQRRRAGSSGSSGRLFLPLLPLPSSSSCLLAHARPPLVVSLSSGARSRMHRRCPCARASSFCLFFCPCSFVVRSPVHWPCSASASFACLVARSCIIAIISLACSLVRSCIVVRPFVRSHVLARARSRMHRRALLLPVRSCIAVRSLFAHLRSAPEGDNSLPPLSLARTQGGGADQDALSRTTHRLHCDERNGGGSQRAHARTAADGGSRGRS
jgi:hypothetical protein